jgi:hypothetical protein
LLCIHTIAPSKIHISNPTTGSTHHVLPNPAAHPYNPHTDTGALYYHAYTGYHFLHITKTNKNYISYMYSIQAGTWKPIALPSQIPPPSSKHFLSPGAICRRSIYFRISPQWSMTLPHIVSFNSNHQSYHMPILSLHTFDVPSNPTLLSIQNILHILLIPQPPSFPITLLRHSLGQWTPQASIMDPAYNLLGKWFSPTYVAFTDTIQLITTDDDVYEHKLSLKQTPTYYLWKYFYALRGSIYTATLVSPNTPPPPNQTSPSSNTTP